MRVQSKLRLPHTGVQRKSVQEDERAEGPVAFGPGLEVTESTDCGHGEMITGRPNSDRPRVSLLLTTAGRSARSAAATRAAGSTSAQVHLFCRWRHRAFEPLIDRADAVHLVVMRDDVHQDGALRLRAAAAARHHLVDTRIGQRRKRVVAEREGVGQRFHDVSFRGFRLFEARPLRDGAGPPFACAQIW